MRMAPLIYRRPLAPGEIDYELILAGVTSAMAIVGLAWLHSRLPNPSCPFAYLTGLPCVTCGGTRAVRALLEGDLVAALRFNPLVVMGISALMAANVYAFAVVGLRLPRIRFGPFPEKLCNIFRVLIGSIILLNWIFLLFTLPVGRH